MLSKDFVLLSGIALSIAMPVAYAFMHRWLEQYTYRSGIPWWIFAGTALGAVLDVLRDGDGELAGDQGCLIESGKGVAVVNRLCELLWEYR